MSEQLIDHPAPESPSRRDMLKVGLGTGGALLVVFGIPSIAKRFQQDTNTASIVTETKVETPPFAPNAFIRIDRQGAVTLVMPMVEMGQGTYTSLAMLLAEELEVGLDQVKLEHAPPNDALYANAILHRQLTGMSSSIPAFWTPLRQAGAVARTLLIEAAAKQRGVDPAVCWAKHGVVSAVSRQLSYGQLVDAAAALPVPTPDSLALKDPKDFTLIGTPAKRLDTPDKVNGRAEFGIDTKQPRMKVAAIAISPVFGGKPKSLDEAAAGAVKGVRQVVRVDEAVAVVADHMGAAKKGLAAAAIQWDDGPNAKVSSADIVRQLEEASKRPGVVARNEGDTEKALASAAQRLEAVYQLPFLAHAAMEPMNCTVHLRKDGCDIWVGTQAPTLTQAVVAQLTGLPKDAVKIHNHLLGGGFGRRLDVDGSVLAVKIAQQVDGPVKVVWSREEDIQHDMYRPYYYDRLSAGLDAEGMPVAWTIVPVALRSSRAMTRRYSRTASTPMRCRGRPNRPMPSRTFMSITSGSSRREFRPPFGAAWARPTMSSSSKASLMNSPMRRSRIPSPIAKRCSAIIRARSPY